MTDSAPTPTCIDLTVPGYIFDLQFHPTNPIIAAATVDGSVLLYDLNQPSGTTSSLTAHSALDSDTPPTTTPLHHFNKVHSSSCRSLSFHPTEHSWLYTAGKDKSVTRIDVNTLQLVDTIANVHEHSINVIQAISKNMIVTGDDDGYIAISDLRIKNSSDKSKWHPGLPTVVQRYDDAADYISDLYFYAQREHTLCATSGDGHLYVYDLRGKGKALAMSENLSSDLLCITGCKYDGERLCVGDREGKIHIFDYDYWGVPNDHILGHPHSVDSMATIDSDTIVTGSSDGLMRLVQVQPNRMIGVVGQHHSDESMDRRRQQLMNNNGKAQSVEQMLQSSEDESEEDADKSSADNAGNSASDSSSDDEEIETTNMAMTSEMPIERLRIAHIADATASTGTRHILASCSHDRLIKLWDVNYFYEEDSDDEAVAAEDVHRDVDTRDESARDVTAVESATTGGDEVDASEDQLVDDAEVDSDEDQADLLDDELQQHEDVIPADSSADASDADAAAEVDASVFLRVADSVPAPSTSTASTSATKNAKAGSKAKPQSVFKYDKSLSSIDKTKMSEQDRRKVAAAKLKQKLEAKQQRAAEPSDSSDSDADSDAEEAAAKPVKVRKKRRGKAAPVQDKRARQTNFFADL